jgi:hypothetical protein
MFKVILTISHKITIFSGQDCFVSLPVGYMDNAMFVLEIVKITYSVWVFPGLK